LNIACTVSRAWGGKIKNDIGGNYLSKNHLPTKKLKFPKIQILKKFMNRITKEKVEVTRTVPGFEPPSSSRG
jgi:hypothetical protein